MCEMSWLEPCGGHGECEIMKKRTTFYAPLYPSIAYQRLHSGHRYAGEGIGVAACFGDIRQDHICSAK